MERMVCENGHGYSEKADFEICPYCNTKLTLREYTQVDVEKTRVWFAKKPPVLVEKEEVKK